MPAAAQRRPPWRATAPAKNSASVVAEMTMRWGVEAWRRVTLRSGVEPRLAPDGTEEAATRWVWKGEEPAADGASAGS
jgi:hypothetical protein